MSYSHLKIGTFHLFCGSDVDATKKAFDILIGKYPSLIGKVTFPTEKDVEGLLQLSNVVSPKVVSVKDYKTAYRKNGYVPPFSYEDGKVVIPSSYPDVGDDLAELEYYLSVVAKACSKWPNPVPIEEALVELVVGHTHADVSLDITTKVDVYLKKLDKIAIAMEAMGEDPGTGVGPESPEEVLSEKYIKKLAARVSQTENTNGSQNTMLASLYDTLERNTELSMNIQDQIAKEMAKIFEFMANPPIYDDTVLKALADGNKKTIEEHIAGHASYLLGYASEDYVNKRVSESSIGHLAGRVDTVDLLPTSGNKNGDIWLVGLEGTVLNQYCYYTSSNRFEFVGTFQGLGINSNNHYTKTESDGITAIIDAHITQHISNHPSYDDSGVSAKVAANTAAIEDLAAISKEVVIKADSALETVTKLSDDVATSTALVEGMGASIAENYEGITNNSISITKLNSEVEKSDSLLVALKANYSTMSDRLTKAEITLGKVDNSSKANLSTITALAASVDGNKRNIATLRSEFELERAKVSTLSSEVHSATGDVANLKASIELHIGNHPTYDDSGLRGDISAHNDSIATIQGVLASHTSSLESIVETNSDQDASIANAISEVAQAKAIAETVSAKLIPLQAEISSVVSSVEASGAELKVWANSVKDLQDLTNAQALNIANNNSEISGLKDSVAVTSEKIDSIEESVETINGSVTSLQENMLASMNKDAEHTASITAMGAQILELQEKDNGILESVNSNIDRLTNVEQRLDDVVSGGIALHNLVVVELPEEGETLEWPSNLSDTGLLVTL